MKSAKELFDEFIEDRMYYEDYIKAHTEHDKEIIQLIDDIIEIEKNRNESEMTFDAVDLLTELKNKLKIWKQQEVLWYVLVK